jgi:isopenicillin N synthase-like dioxygenase
MPSRNLPVLMNDFSGDCKEALATSDDPYDPGYGCPDDFDKSFYKARPINQWPEIPRNYKEVHDEYRAAVLKFSKQFLHILALALELEETYFDYMTRFPMAGLRALYYPPQPVEGDVGIGAHNDYSWFTLVWQITATPALEVLNKNGEWISAPPIPGALTVNVGDFFERATNDEFVSTVHRVINKTGQERYSLAYFFTPSHDVTIETVPTCYGENRPKRYEDVNAGDWQRERLLRARYKHPASIAARANGTA